MINGEKCIVSTSQKKKEKEFRRPTSLHEFLARNCAYISNNPEITDSYTYFRPHKWNHDIHLCQVL